MNSNETPVLDLPQKEAALPKVPGLASRPAPKGSAVVRVGVIGYGYWGPNVVRNLQSLDNCQVVAVCDKSSDALRRVHRVYPQIRPTTDLADVLTAPEIDAVAVVTPVWTHFELAKAALENGKHVFVE